MTHVAQKLINANPKKLKVNAIIDCSLCSMIFNLQCDLKKKVWTWSEMLPPCGTSYVTE
jgi:hypothetical protein